MLSGTMVNSSLQNPGGASPEQQLIRRVQDGERELFYELVRPYERRVYTAAFAILRNEADAEDAAQEALLKAFKHIRQFRAEARFSTWLIQITKKATTHPAISPIGARFRRKLLKEMRFGKSFWKRWHLLEKNIAKFSCCAMCSI